MSENTDEDDEFEKQLGDVRSRAQKLGVSGAGTDTSDSSTEGDTETREADSDATRTDGSDSASTQESSRGEAQARAPGGPDVHDYPNPDRELGALADTYENNNVFLSPQVVDAVEELWDDIEYEWKKSNRTELSKNWDFYMACFRVILNDPDLVRDELGMDTD